MGLFNKICANKRCKCKTCENAGKTFICKNLCGGCEDFGAFKPAHKPFCISYKPRKDGKRGW